MVSPQIFKYLCFQAPEVIRMRDPNPYTTLSDVYSFGICMYEVLSGSLPYSDINSRDLILFRVNFILAIRKYTFVQVAIGKLTPDGDKIRSDVPKKLRALYERCIKYQRTDRPEFSEASCNLCMSFLNFERRIHNMHIVISTVQVLEELGQITLPKLVRSVSAPCLYRLSNEIIHSHTPSSRYLGFWDQDRGTCNPFILCTLGNTGSFYLLTFLVCGCGPNQVFTPGSLFQCPRAYLHPHSRLLVSYCTFLFY